MFVHIYKNAGSSISWALRQAFDNDLAYSPPPITGVRSLDLRADYRLIRSNGYFAVKATKGIERLRTLEAMNNGHLSIKTFEENISITEFESFAVVRNPWAWQVSLFNYARKEASHFQYGRPEYENFDLYIRWRCREEVRLQSHYIETHWGGIGVKHLLRFETLADDWRELAEKTGWMLPQLPHKNQSTFDDWKSYYTDETAGLVGNVFSRDCHLFNYSFDG